MQKTKKTINMGEQVNVSCTAKVHFLLAHSANVNNKEC